MIEIIARIFTLLDRDRLDIWDIVKDDPASWAYDHYYATHRSGVTIWIANSAYGVEIYPNGKHDYGHKFTPSFFEKRAIWHALKRGRDNYRRNLRIQTNDRLTLSK